MKTSCKQNYFIIEQKINSNKSDEFTNTKSIIDVWPWTGTLQVKI